MTLFPRAILNGFISHLPRCHDHNHCFHQDDILFSRVRTSGIVTERYLIDGTVFEMYDVGGQVRLFLLVPHSTTASYGISHL
jgi:hypothetical protein